MGLGEREAVMIESQGLQRLGEVQRVGQQLREEQQHRGYQDLAV
jgi:hypothetical protein